MKKYLEFLNESLIGKSNHFETEEVLTSLEIENMLKKGMSKEEVVEWLNKNFVGLIRIFPLYNEYYINVLSWEIALGPPAKVSASIFLYIRYDSYWSEKKFNKMIRSDVLSLDKFDHAIKIKEKKGKKIQN